MLLHCPSSFLFSIIWCLQMRARSYLMSYFGLNWFFSMAPICNHQHCRAVLGISRSNIFIIHASLFPFRQVWVWCSGEGGCAVCPIQPPFQQGIQRCPAICGWCWVQQSSGWGSGRLLAHAFSLLYEAGASHEGHGMAPAKVCTTWKPVGTVSFHNVFMCSDYDRSVGEFCSPPIENLFWWLCQCFGGSARWTTKSLEDAQKLLQHRFVPLTDSMAAHGTKFGWSIFWYWLKMHLH